MNKEYFLETYIDIETKVFNKAEKNKKFERLFEDIKTYWKNINSIDILEIIEYLTTNNITIRQPLYKNLIYPILIDQVEKNNIKAIKGILKLDQQLVSYQSYTKDNKYSIWTLLEKGLSIEPNDMTFLRLNEKKTREYLNYTLHEIPIGVIFGEDGATIEDCEELIKEVDKYEMLCKKLKRDESDLIRECKYYYTAYRDYLSVYKNYNNFADYLEKECLE